MKRRHIEQGLQSPGYAPGAGRRIASNYFDLAMVMDYWSDKALNHHTEATTMLYAEGRDTPRMMSVGLHCRIAGKPGRIFALERFLRYVSKKPGVWFARRIDIARHWAKRYPAAEDASAASTPVPRGSLKPCAASAASSAPRVTSTVSFLAL